MQMKQITHGFKFYEGNETLDREWGGGKSSTHFRQSGLGGPHGKETFTLIDVDEKELSEEEG